jgi:hypothetical protein
MDFALRMVAERPMSDHGIHRLFHWWNIRKALQQQ